MRGLPFFLLICLLASAPLYSQTLGAFGLGVLLALYVRWLVRVGRERAEA